MKNDLKKAIWKLGSAAVALSLFASTTAFAQVMSSGSYKMEIDSANAGGGLSSSGSYSLEDTAGEIATGNSESGNFALSAGYQQPSAGGADNIAPSVPTGLVAAGLSSSSIGLSWNASTDNVGVSAYHVYRDNSHIATTTSTSYTDTGLTAETTYSYTVTALDAAFNVSAHSATATASTLAVAISEPGSISGGSAPVYIYDIRSNPGLRHVDIQWKTDPPSSAKLYWGETQEYEKGFQEVLGYSAGHLTRIEGLDPDTEYYVRIIALAENGRTGSTEVRVRTRSGPDIYGPTNVIGFTATGKNGGIQLTWQNPLDLDFDSVVIVRSDEFFPNTVNEGEIVYEGADESFFDSNVEIGPTYYYTAFAKDELGNLSSGAVASAKASGEAIPHPFENLPSAPSVHPEIQGLKLSDFEFIQDGKEVLPIGADTLLINGLKDLKVRLDYDRVPEVLKTIAITFVHPIDATKQFTFLLRANEDKSAYEAVIGPLGEAGVYGIRIAVVDHKNRGMKRLEGNLMAAVARSIRDIVTPDEMAMALMIQITKVFSLLFLIVLLVLAVLDERKKRGINKKLQITPPIQQ